MISSDVTFVDTRNSDISRLENSNIRDLERLRQVCQDFESIFVNILLKEARNSMSEDTIFGPKSHGIKTMEAMYDEEMARSIAKGEGMGISKALYNQLKVGVGKG